MTMDDVEADDQPSRGRSLAPGVRLGRIDADDRPPATGERFTDLVTTGAVRIETIHSSDSPDPREYCQDHDEWVLVVEGGAVLEVGGNEVVMGAGEWIMIPTGVVHRVVSTVWGTRWLAVHITDR